MADYIFTNTPVNPELLSSEIEASSIVNVLESITVSGVDTTITFTGTLSGGDQTTLNNVVAAHNVNDDDGVGIREDFQVDSVPIDKEKIDFVGFNVSQSSDTVTISPPTTINMFYGYSTINNTLTTTFLQVPINVEGVKDSIFTHSANSPDVTINKTSRYKVNIQYNADAVANTRSATEGALFLNGVALDESFCYGYHRTTNQGENTGSATVTLNLTNGDVLSVGVREINGNARLRTPTSMRITIEEKL